MVYRCENLQIQYIISDINIQEIESTYIEV